MTVSRLVLLMVCIVHGSASALTPASTPVETKVATADVDGRIARSRLAVAFTYPGAGLRYFLIDRWAVELGAQYSPGTISALVAGGRLARYFDGFAGIFPYIGVEGDMASYKDAKVTGTGMLGAVFLGVEWFVHNRVSLQADAGPAFMRLTSKPASLVEQGMDIIINAGLTLYLTKGSRSEVHQ